MLDFIGRSEEIKILESLNQTKGFQMCVLYGRRRIGKSTLLKYFTGDKNPLFFTAIKTSAKRNLELFTKRVMERFSPETLFLSSSSFEDIFSYLTEKCREERIIVVIDEFPYLAEENAEIISLLQSYIDNEWQHGNMFLILSGSSLSFMEDEVLSEKSPLFGRRTAQIKLEPFDYMESAKFVENFTPEEKAICYGATSGIAKYLSLFDDSKSLDENLISLYFSKSGYLFEEAENLLTQEFRNISLYSTIIEGVASGANRANEIAEKAHLDKTSVSHALKNLLSTGIIRKISAITDEKNKKKVQYQLIDNMFRFWYRFVPDGLDVIQLGKGDIYYTNVVKPKISEYMGMIFEDMCRRYTLTQGICGNLRCLVTAAGTWWGTNPIEKKETDIDVVGLDKINHKAVIGECKFTNKPVDKTIFDALTARKNLLKEYQVVQYILFSKAGFSDQIIERAKEDDLLLVTLDDLYS